MIRYFIDFIEEWKIRAILYWIYGKKIIVKNPGIIQWDDFTFIHRLRWQDKYTIEDMEIFMKDLKDYKGK